MVKIIGYKERKNQDGASFFILVLQGDMEFVQSSATGKFYATAKRASITSTFDEDTCKAFIGKEMAGSIAKVPCDSYEYTIPETKEVISLTHHYVYLPEGISVESQNAETKLSAISIGGKQIEASRYAA